MFNGLIILVYSDGMIMLMISNKDLNVLGKNGRELCTECLSYVRWSNNYGLYQIIMLMASNQDLCLLHSFYKKIFFNGSSRKHWIIMCHYPPQNGFYLFCFSDRELLLIKIKAPKLINSLNKLMFTQKNFNSVLVQ